MPLALVGRTKDAVVSLPASDHWQEGVRRFLGVLTDDSSIVDRHLDLLERRHAGRLPWREILAGRTLPNGRPMPPSRAYAEMLVEEDVLPLYERDGVRFSVDLHNPNNEAAVPEYDLDRLEIAIVADVGAFGPSSTPGSFLPSGSSFEEEAAARAVRGAVLGRLVASLVEATGAGFAYADIGSTGWVVSMSTRPESVVHPAPSGVRPWDFLWSITAWGSDLLESSPRLRDRLERLEITDQIREGIDRYERPHVRIERRDLAGGQLLVQYRWLFGSEGRRSRAALDTPLAQQAGLRSTNLLFRA